MRCSYHKTGLSSPGFHSQMLTRQLLVIVIFGCYYFYRHVVTCRLGVYKVFSYNSIVHFIDRETAIATFFWGTFYLLEIANCTIFVKTVLQLRVNIAMIIVYS